MEILTKRWVHITLITLLFIVAAVSLFVAGFTFLQDIELVRFTVEPLGLTDHTTLVGWYHNTEVIPVNASEVATHMPIGSWSDMYYNPANNTIVGNYGMQTWGCLGLGITFLVMSIFGCVITRKKY